MTARSTVVGDRRRAAADRTGSKSRHPARRVSASRPASPAPPPAAFYAIAVVATVFTLLGLAMVMSATSIAQFHKGNSPWSSFQRQVMWAGFGAAAVWLALKVPMHLMRRWVGPFTLLSLCLMVLPLLPNVGASVNGARAWIRVGELTFQPSELLKLTLMLQCAHLLAGRQSEPNDFGRALRPVAILGVLGALLCLLQGDLGSAIVLVGIVFAMAFIAGAPIGLMAVTGTLAAAAGLLIVMASDRRAARFTAFLDIAAHKDHLSYQTWQAMIATAQGGLTGSGVGRGESKLGEFLPLAHSDFIFAVVAEELGMIGVIAVLGGFLVMVYAGIQVAMATQDRFHSIVAAGVVAWFALQTTINVGGVVGIMPVTGLTLPFFSAGGSSLLVTLAATGLLLNVARNVR